MEGAKASSQRMEGTRAVISFISFENDSCVGNTRSCRMTAVAHPRGPSDVQQDRLSHLAFTLLLLRAPMIRDTKPGAHVKGKHLFTSTHFCSFCPGSGTPAKRAAGAPAFAFTRRFHPLALRCTQLCRRAVRHMLRHAHAASRRRAMQCTGQQSSGRRAGLFQQKTEKHTIANPAPLVRLQLAWAICQRRALALELERAAAVAFEVSGFLGGGGARYLPNPRAHHPVAPDGLEGRFMTFRGLV